MSVVLDISTIGAAVAAVGSGIYIPIWSNRTRRRTNAAALSAQTAAATSASALASWQESTQFVKTERDELRLELVNLRNQLDQAEDRAARRLRATEADFLQQLTVCRTRVTELEREVAAMRLRYGVVPPAP